MKLIRIISVLLVVLFSSTAISGERSCNFFHIRKELRDYVNQFADEESFSGTVLVAHEGRILLLGGYGKRNYEYSLRNNVMTIYNIASLTKPFTATAILMLEQDGLLDIDDPVQIYVPELDYADGVTIRHCLNHSSGLPEYLNHGELWNNTTVQHSPEDLLSYYDDGELVFQPGSEMVYTNTNYVLLGLIMERVTGTSYAQFIKSRIFSPLHMHRSFYDPADEIFSFNMATGYDSLDPVTETMYFHPSLAYSAGAIHSTITDMYLWSESFKTERLLSEQSKESMFTPGLGNYGFGWYIDELTVDDMTYRQRWHWGSTFGFGSYLTCLEDEDLTIIILQNLMAQSPDDFSPLVEGIVDTVLN